MARPIAVAVGPDFGPTALDAIMGLHYLIHSLRIVRHVPAGEGVL